MFRSKTTASTVRPVKTSFLALKNTFFAEKTPFIPDTSAQMVDS